MKNYILGSQHNFDAAHWLVGHEGKCKNLHGHNWVVHLELMAHETIKEGSQRGMVLDFYNLKKDFRRLVDDFDHSVIAEEGTISDNLLRAFKEEGFERIRLVPFRPTCENFAPYFYNEMKKLGYPVKSITVYETDINFCKYEEV